MIYEALTKEQAAAMLEEGRSIWACAYEINPKTRKPRYRSFPAEGSFYWAGDQLLFAPFLKSRNRTGIGIRFQSRKYADTKEEAYELYEQLIRMEQARYGLDPDPVLQVYDRRTGQFVPQPPVMTTFFRELDSLCKRYGYSIGQDCEGFVLEPYQKENMDALRNAQISLDE